MGETIPNQEAMAEFLKAEQVRQGARLFLEAIAAGAEAQVTDDQVQFLLDKLYTKVGHDSPAARTKLEEGLRLIALAPNVE
ncbi:hypothetical protein KBC79_00920 [Candidatus Woesebacteria bacterium]|nr:hypothetical protein [Candidatus Woesebacteria bacterium]